MCPSDSTLGLDAKGPNLESPQECWDYIAKRVPWICSVDTIRSISDEIGYPAAPFRVPPQAKPSYPTIAIKLGLEDVCVIQYLPKSTQPDLASK
jgi:hypothetical protein